MKQQPEKQQKQADPHEKVFNIGHEVRQYYNHIYNLGVAEKHRQYQYIFEVICNACNEGEKTYVRKLAAAWQESSKKKRKSSRPE